MKGFVFSVGMIDGYVLFMKMKEDDGCDEVGKRKKMRLWLRAVASALLWW